MGSMMTILSRKGWPLIAAVALLLTPLMAATSYAREVPVKISYTGSIVPIPVDVDDDEAVATVVDAQSKGSFGASMSHIVTEWTPTGLCDDGYVQFALIHSAVVVTFSNGDQLFGAGAGNGWMCLDLDPAGDGFFYGEAYGDFTDGTGRFEGASGSFSSPFTGNNLTFTEFGYPFGPIQGGFQGRLTLQ
ncbi:MAG: hypothetical protein AMS22_09385 [Thiotrichales bacterium SG8_50]|jgi:hypothetical protein|nr:MAG: hypothetical protein AMS22_09385 [Thiotrichales bacterium SG8_50]